VYNFFLLAEKFRDTDPELFERLLEEARAAILLMKKDPYSQTTRSGVQKKIGTSPATSL